MSERLLRIGTRGSELALWQARYVRERLLGHWGAQLRIELVEITTQGDLDHRQPLHAIGGKGVFVRAIEEELLRKTVDLAVHSMKDLPSTLPGGLRIVATAAREDPRDVLVGPVGTTVERLAAGSRVGTGSPRRGALLRRRNSAVEIVPIRGNVPTRIAKVDAGEVDAVVLAAAGLNRLGLAHRITQHLDPEDFVPAPCQGIVALECREDDEETCNLAVALTDPIVMAAATAERAFLARVGGGCNVPLGCHAQVDRERLVVRGVIVDPSARPYFAATLEGPVEDATRLGVELAETLLAMGGGRILDSL